MAVVLPPNVNFVNMCFVFIMRYKQVKGVLHDTVGNTRLTTPFFTPPCGSYILARLPAIKAKGQACTTFRLRWTNAFSLMPKTPFDMMDSCLLFSALRAV